VLVDELLCHSDRYKVKLDRRGRKDLKLMRYEGQLPSLDLLLVASCLFKVRIFVYFWSTEPVIYQFDEYEQVIHVQCISGIHFNPLVEVDSYHPPVTEGLIVNSPIQPDVECESKVIVDDAEDEVDGIEFIPSLLVSESDTIYCDHHQCPQPQIYVYIGKHALCSVLDTAAEISLINEMVIPLIENMNIGVPKEERLCNIVGLTGKVIPITRTIIFAFKLNNGMVLEHKFAVVPPDAMPHCILFGLDFMDIRDVSVNIDQGTCTINNEQLRLAQCDLLKYFRNTLYLAEERKLPHSFVITQNNNDIRFQIAKSMNTVTGMGLLVEDYVLGVIQSQDHKIKLVIKMLSVGNRPNRKLGEFTRFMSRMVFENNILYFADSNNDLKFVAPNKMYVEVALLLHHEFAHIGRDKLLHVLDSLMWHPARYKVANDITTTCPTCQKTKVYASQVVPPTLKIKSEYPFELMAADLMNLPQTRRGNIGVLVVTDHYSKWTAAVPIRNKRSNTVIMALNEVVFPLILKLPTTLLTDNGPEFTSGEFEGYLTELGIKHQLTTPYSPQSNGGVERVNRTIQSFLKNLVSDGQEWDVHLPKFLSVYNNTLHCEIGTSPSAFLLNVSHNINPSIRGSVRIKERWKVGHPSFVPFKVSDLVLMRVQKKGYLNVNKLSPNYSGPFRIIKVHENGVTYELDDLQSNKVVRAHHRDIHLFKKPPEYLTVHPYYKLLYETSRVEDNCNHDYMNLNVPCFSESDSESSFSETELVTSNPALTTTLPHSSAALPVPGSPVVIGGSNGRECLGCVFESGRERGCLETILSAPEMNYVWGLDSSKLFPNLQEDFWEVSSLEIDIGEVSGHTSVGGVNSCSGLEQGNSSTSTIHSVAGAEAYIDSCVEQFCPNASLGSTLESLSQLEGFIDDCVAEFMPGSFTVDAAINTHSDTNSNVGVTSRVRLPRVTYVDEPPISPVHHTRAKGPVRDLPNVQARILERVYNCNKAK
jgi:hypothetical protein